MGREEIEGPAEDQSSPDNRDNSPTSSSERTHLQGVTSPAHRLVSPTRADFIDGTPPGHIRQHNFTEKKAELEDERERLLEKSKNSPNSVDKWLKLLRDRDELLRLSFCQENASILEGQIILLENTCKSVERLARCPDPLVEQFCTAVGELIKLCPLVLTHVRNPSLHDHMERGQSPLQPSAPSPQQSWVENERRMSRESRKDKESPTNHEFLGSPTNTPPKYSSTQNVGQAVEAFYAGPSVWSPLTPDETSNTNHIQIAENSLIGSYFALPGPNVSRQEYSSPGSLLSISNPLNTQVTLATQTSPMMKSVGEDVPLYKPTDLNNNDSFINDPSNTSQTSPMLKSVDDVPVFKPTDLNNNDSLYKSTDLNNTSFINNPINTSLTSPMFKSVEGEDVPADFNNNDSFMNEPIDIPAYMDYIKPAVPTFAQVLLNHNSEKQTLAVKKLKPSENKMPKTNSFKTIRNSNAKFLSPQTPLLKFANTKDMSIFKNNNYTPVELNVADLKNDNKWCKVKNRRRKKKKVCVTEDSSTCDDTPIQDMASPPKKARIVSEYDDEKVTRALTAAIQNLGQPSRYVVLEHLEPNWV